MKEMKNKKETVVEKKVWEILKRYVPEDHSKHKWIRPLFLYLRGKYGFISDYTLRKYARGIANTLFELELEGLETDPRKIGRREIQSLLTIWKNREVQWNTIIWKLNQLNLILKYYNNEIIRQLNLNLKPVERTNARWIPREIMDEIFEVSEELGPQYAIRIHLGYDLLLRKSEMLRLKVRDFNFAYSEDGEIHVLGKGRHGGKPALLPFASDTPRYLKAYLEWREDLIRKARRRGELIPKDDWFIIWYRPGIGIGKESQTTADNRLIPIMTEVRKRLNLPKSWRFGYHDLRRSGARRYWEDGMSLLAIQALLRHENLATTIKYLGLKIDILKHALHSIGPRKARVGRNLTLLDPKTYLQIAGVALAYR